MLPEIKSHTAKARPRRGIEVVKLTNRIEGLKMQAEDTEEDLPSNTKRVATGGVAPAD